MWSKNLMPLSVKGLWEAEMTTPTSTRMSRVRKEMAGVGSGPTRMTSMPAAQKPEVSAYS